MGIRLLVVRPVLRFQMLVSQTLLLRGRGRWGPGARGATGWRRTEECMRLVLPPPACVEEGQLVSHGAQGQLRSEATRRSPLNLGSRKRLLGAAGAVGQLKVTLKRSWKTESSARKASFALARRSWALRETTAAAWDQELNNFAHLPFVLGFRAHAAGWPTAATTAATTPSATQPSGPQRLLSQRRSLFLLLQPEGPRGPHGVGESKPKHEVDGPGGGQAWDSREGSGGALRLRER